jgi:hypothetical protein
MQKNFLPFLVISIWFQLIWVIAVIGRETYFWLTCTLVWLTYALTKIAVKQMPMARLLTVAFAGLIIDGLNIYFSVFEFKGSSYPSWLVILWFMFAWYAQYLMQMLSRWPTWLTLSLFGLLGMGSYYLGFKLGAVNFGHPLIMTLSLLIAEWLLLGWLITKAFDYGRTTNPPP